MFSELHGQNPVVTPCNRQNLNHFEMQSRKLAPGGGGGGSQHMGGQQSGPRQFPQSGGGMRPPLIPRPSRPNGPLLPGQPRMMNQGGAPFGQNQPWHSMPPQGAPQRQNMHGGPPRGNMSNMMRMPLNRGPNSQPLLRAPGPPNDPRAQMPQQMDGWVDHNSHSGHQPQPNNMNMAQTGQPAPQMPPRPSGKRHFYTFQFVLY